MELTKEQLARVWLQCAPMNVWSRLRQWREQLGGAEQVWDVFSPDFYDLLGESAYADLADARAKQCRDTLTQLRQLNARPVFLGDPDYPALLAAIDQPPDVLFVRGALPPAGSPAVAIVGSRSATRYGLAHARRIAQELAGAGVTIVSGLARGIDAAAHEGALEAGGRTVAVLGSGVGNVYPPENRKLAEAIVEKGGAVISELSPDAKPLSFHFPVRNRIISGLCGATLLIEAQKKSGTHSTINNALDQGREVFALPGSVDAPGSELPLMLLKDGAKICTCGEDILSFMGWKAAPPAQESFLEADAEPTDPILKALALEEKTLDELIACTGMPAGELSTKLTLLEISGSIERRPGRAYALRR